MNFFLLVRFVSLLSGLDEAVFSGESNRELIYVKERYRGFSNPLNFDDYGDYGFILM